MKDEIVKFREVWIIFALLAVIIILLFVIANVNHKINKFPIKIEMRENKQVWEANCNCKCESQEAKPCITFNSTIPFPQHFWNSTIPKSFYIISTQYFWNFSKLDRDKCLSCWDTPSCPKYCYYYER